MADGSKIEWCDATWNPVRGCTRISPGCGGPNHEGGCYAEKVAARFSGPGQPYHGFAERTPHGGRWTGKVALIEGQLDLPLRWKRPRRIFVNSMSDLFHEALPDEAIDRVFAVMALAPQHTFIVLTKRAKRMRSYLCSHDVGARWALAGFYMRGAIIETPAGAVEWTRHGLRNVWLGVSVEGHAHADERIPDLLATPAAVRFISAEPLLGPIDISFWTAPNRLLERPALDWAICGGESGPGARPMHPDWARALRDQCIAAGVPFFFKQWGEWLAGENLGWPLARWQDGNEGRHPSPDHIEWRHFTTPGEYGAFTIRVGKHAAGRLLDGREWSEFPE